MGSSAGFLEVLAMHYHPVPATGISIVFKGIHTTPSCRENGRGRVRQGPDAFSALMSLHNHVEVVFHPDFIRDCNLYIIISFLIINYIERFFINKKY